MLLSHGWPGSVWEFYKLIPRLTDPDKYGGRREDGVDVVIPSIPGYGFSESPHQQGGWEGAVGVRVGGGGGRQEDVVIPSMGGWVSGW